MNRIQPEEFDEPFAEVKKLSGNIYGFKLSAREVKHIRRCLYNRELNHPGLESDKDNLTPKILGKFSSLGKLELNRKREKISFGYTHSISKRDYVSYQSNPVPEKCSFEGCSETEDLEVHHKNPISNGGLNEPNNLVYLCPRHHDYIELKKVLKRKEQEMEIIKNKITKLEQSFVTNVI